MKITKILSAEATPAKAILARAARVALTSRERAQLPHVLTVNGQTIEVGIKDARPLQVGDVLLDEGGHFYVVVPAAEKVLVIKGDEQFAAEAAVALINRGIDVAKVDGGFAILPDIALVKMLSSAGVEFAEEELPFDPIRPPKHKGHGEGCCCGHHHHEEGECCCGGEHHHHHHEEDECCCGGEHHHHHHEEDECCCGGEHHHHHHDEGECCCGGEHHHHHHEEGECCCGGEHHHHHHEDGECCCGGSRCQDGDDDKKVKSE